MSATPEEIAAELGGMFMRLATETEDEAALRRINTARAAAALIRAQAERVRVLEEALKALLDLVEFSEMSSRDMPAHEFEAVREDAERQGRAALAKAGAPQ